jgi:hypothetical protein
MASSGGVSFGRDQEVFSKKVEAQLDRVLTSEFFATSAQQRLFLKTIVTESLAGRTDSLKEILLAKEVLRRPDYDPSRHNQVRVAVNGCGASWRNITRELEQKIRSELRFRRDIM